MPLLTNKQQIAINPISYNDLPLIDIPSEDLPVLAQSSKSEAALDWSMVAA